MKTKAQIALALVAAVSFIGCTSSPRDFYEFEKPTENTGLIPDHHATNVNLTTTWTRGCGKGVKVYLPTDAWDTGVRRIYAWRLCEFDESGRLLKIHEQSLQTDAISIEQLCHQRKK